MAESGNFDRAAEVESLLASDVTMLGQVWEKTSQGLPPNDIAAAFNTTAGPVYAVLQLIRALRDGEVPTSPSVADRNAARIRTWLKNPELSSELRAALQSQLTALQAIADNASSRDEEEAAAALVSEQVLTTGSAGIYVYTLPHYVRHPVDPETGKTLLKVGHSARDAYFRAGSQGRLTALPEDPILLRVYPCDESAHAEREFHTWLADAHHSRSAARRGGSEWFVTSTRFLDRVARSMGLDIVTYNDDFDVTEGGA